MQLLSPKEVVVLGGLKSVLLVVLPKELEVRLGRGESGLGKGVVGRQEDVEGGDVVG
jgi:hypothetical protein